MRVLWLLTVVACSSAKTEEPVKQQAAPPAPAPKRNELAKVTTTPPLGITNIVVRRLGTPNGPTRGAFLVSWETSRSSPIDQVRAHVRCRVNGHNIVRLGVSGGSKQVSFYADPFDAEPGACEVRWVEAQGRHDTVVARACFRDGELTDGACPAETFPTASMPPGFGIDFTTVDTPKRNDNPIPRIAMNRGAVQMSAIATLAKPLEKREARYELRCQEGSTIGTSSDRLAHIKLERLEANETIYGWEWFFDGDDKLEAMTKVDRCELEFLAVVPDAKKSAAESLGKFCIQNTGETKPGSCDPPLQKQ